MYNYILEGCALLIHYLDNSATTPLCNEAISRMTEYMNSGFGNPSSLHLLGIEAEIKLQKCREQIADRLYCDKGELYFTSCGSESNNLAIFGAARAKRRDGKRIVTTAVEHPSVMRCMDELEGDGFEIIRLSPDESGNIPVSALESAVTADTILVSMMAVNNETGALLPINEIKKAVRLSGSSALVHIDAVQAFGKLDINPQKLGADLVSISAHKIHGPKGIGALYVKKGVRILPLIHGGGQEKGLRSGTESTILCEGFAAAVKALPQTRVSAEKTEALNNLLRTELEKIEGIRINSPENALPYILSFSVEGIRSETMLHHLENLGVFVSSGSACAKGERSHVLKAMGLTDSLIDSAIRVSISRFTSEDDLLALINGIKDGINKLVRRKR